MICLTKIDSLIPPPPPHPTKKQMKVQYEELTVFLGGGKTGNKEHFKPKQSYSFCCYCCYVSIYYTLGGHAGNLN